VNTRIRVPQVRVIDVDGAQIGVLPTREALRMAEEKGYDLVEISPQAKPPVCRIMDFGKYKYEQSKKEKMARKKQHVFHLKEIRLRPKIDEHDYQYKTRNIHKFLEEGNKVKVSIEFRGREMAHLEFGQSLIKRLETDLAAVGTVEQRAKMEGRNLTMILMPKAS